MKKSLNKIKCGCDEDGWDSLEIKKEVYKLCIITKDGYCVRHPPSGHTPKAIIVRLTLYELTAPNKRRCCPLCGELFFEFKDTKFPHKDIWEEFK